VKQIMLMPQKPKGRKKKRKRAEGEDCRRGVQDFCREKVFRRVSVDFCDIFFAFFERKRERRSVKE